MLVPWDVYIGKEPERWFGTVEEYGDLYDFVRSNAGLLDDYSPWANVVLTVPISSNQAAMAAAAKSTRLLVRAGYPCRLAAYGVAGDIVHVPVDPADFRNADVVVKTIPSVTGAEDGAAVERAVAGVRIVEFDPSQDSYRTMARNVGELVPPAYRVDDSNLLVLPRWKPGDPGAPRVVHLARIGGEMRKASLWLSDACCGKSASLEAVLLQPGQPQQKLTAQKSGDGILFTGIEIDVWGILVISGSRNR